MDLDDIQSVLRRAGIDLIPLGQTLFRAILILGAGLFLAHVLRARVQNLLSNRAFGRNGAILVGRCISITVIVGSVLAVLGSFGANWTALLTFLSASTVAVALAIQDVLKNFVAGVLLLIERPFRVGDVIRIRDVHGEVQGIDIRTTLVRSGDGALVMIPNAVVYTEILTNRSLAGSKRLELRIEVRTLSIPEAERRIASVLENTAGLRRPIPAPVIKSITAELTLFELSVLIDADRAIEADVLHRLAEVLEDSTIDVT